jgi:hypothetical protein
MTSVPDFSQAPAAAAVELTTPTGGEPGADVDAQSGAADQETSAEAQAEAEAERRSARGGEPVPPGADA